MLQRDENAGQRHSELIIPMVDALLREAGLALRALDAVAFGAGPGSFTGLRIACGVAQGLAFGADLPVIPVGTLAALAQASGAERVIAAMDARVGEIYHAAYVRAGDDWGTLHEPSLCLPQQAPAVDGGGWTGCGSAFGVHAEALRARYGDVLGAVAPDALPHARAIAELAVGAYRAGRTLDPALATPLYVRDKVAMTVSERAQRKPSQARDGT